MKYILEVTEILQNSSFAKYPVLTRYSSNPDWLIDEVRSRYPEARSQGYWTWTARQGGKFYWISVGSID